MNNFQLICAVLSSAAYREKRNVVNQVETPSGVQDGVGAGKYTLDPASGFLFGEAGKDVLDGVDVLLGGAGDDELQGGAGNDAVAGDEGSDRLFGEAGEDVITGAAGDDLVVGGQGDDSFYYNFADGGRDHISDSGGNDTLYLQGLNTGNAHLTLGSLVFTNGTLGNELHIDGFDPDDSLNSLSIEKFVFDDRVLTKAELLASLDIEIAGTPEADTLIGTSSRDRITGLASDDLLVGQGGNDTLDPGADIVFGENVSTPIHKLTEDPPWTRICENESTEIVWMKPA